MVGGDDFAQPLLVFEQPAALCSTLTQPLATRVDGNVYARPSYVAAQLVRMSPAATESCLADFDSLEAFREVAPAMEAHGRYFDLRPRSILRT